MAHHAEELPSKFMGAGSLVSLAHNTAITQAPDGQEYRRSVWAQPLRTYQLSLAGASLDDLRELHEFVIARGGTQHSFNITDPLDYTSASDHVGTTAIDDVFLSGVAAATQSRPQTTLFQLAKHYDDDSTGRFEVSRAIRKPKSGTVKIGVSGVAKTENTHFTIDYTKGQVDFAAGTSPLNLVGDGNAVTAGFDFFVPVRFGPEVDRWASSSVTGFDAGSMTITLIEVKNGGDVSDINQRDTFASDVSRMQYDGGYDGHATSGTIQIEFQHGHYHVVSPGGAMDVRLPALTGTPSFQYSISPGGPYFAIFNNSASNTLTVKEYQSSSWSALTGTSTIPPFRCRKVWLSQGRTWRMF